MFIGVWRTVNAGSETTKVATAIPRVYMNTNVACLMTACIAGENLRVWIQSVVVRAEERSAASVEIDPWGSGPLTKSGIRLGLGLALAGKHLPWASTTIKKRTENQIYLFGVRAEDPLIYDRGIGDHRIGLSCRNTLRRGNSVSHRLEPASLLESGHSAQFSAFVQNNTEFAARIQFVKYQGRCCCC